VSILNTVDLIRGHVDPATTHGNYKDLGDYEIHVAHCGGLSPHVYLSVENFDQHGGAWQEAVISPEEARRVGYALIEAAAIQEILQDQT